MNSPLVTGLGAVSAAGRGIDALWTACASGETNIRRITHFDPRDSATDEAGFVPQDDGAPPPGTPERLRHLAGFAINEALNDARVTAKGTGLVIATTDSEGVSGTEVWHQWLDNGQVSDDTTFNAVAQEIGLDGPVLSVGTASAAGAVALYVGTDLLARGRADRVVVCGADTVTETAFYGLTALRTLSAKGCRPFQKGRSGMRISEGAAAVVLESPEAVRRRGCHVYAQLAGAGFSNFGLQAARPDNEGIQHAIRAALSAAGIGPGEVDYVNAHAAGTRKGDSAELAALEEVIGERLQDVPIVSSKAAIGHCQGAAGVMEAVVSLLTLDRGEVLATLLSTEIDEPSAHLTFGPVPGAPPPRTALSISCGLGAANAAIIFRRIDG